MSQIEDRLRNALSRHDKFRSQNSGYEYTGTAFDVTAIVRDGECQVRVVLPELDTVVQNETVPDVVRSGWRDTLDRRLKDGPKAAGLQGDIEYTLEEKDTVVIARYTFTPKSPRVIGEEVSAIATFVEGTYVQGIIPGYEYDEPVTGLIQQAGEQAGSDEIDPEKGGMPL